MRVASNSKMRRRICASSDRVGSKGAEERGGLARPDDLLGSWFGGEPLVRSQSSQNVSRGKWIGARFELGDPGSCMR